MIEVFSDIIQGSDEWRKVRSGIPTASNFSTILAKGRGDAESKTRRDYLLKLAGELITGEPAESYSNGYMERGIRMEEEARNFYAFLRDVEPECVGFIRNGNRGCSPDSTLGTDGFLEIKTVAPHILIDLILKDDFPPKFRAQVQGQLWVGEREWCDLLCYFSGMPPLIKRAYREPGYIIQLADAVDQFNDELVSVVERIRSYGMEKAA
jgi:hypothetical protein